MIGLDLRDVYIVTNIKFMTFIIVSKLNVDIKNKYIECTEIFFCLYKRCHWCIETGMVTVYFQLKINSEFKGKFHYQNWFKISGRPQFIKKKWIFGLDSENPTFILALHNPFRSH